MTGLTLPTARSFVRDAFLEEPKSEAETGEMPRAFYSIHDMRIGKILRGKRMNTKINSEDCESAVEVFSEMAREAAAERKKP
jgi:hypothetical protein